MKQSLVWPKHLACFAVVLAVCGIYYKSDKEKPEAKDSWWNTALIYQVYPRSFQDSNADGVGDIAGILSRINYFKYLGVDAIWINPMFESAMFDFGYDVTNHSSIDSLFGTNQQFQKLILELQKNGFKVIIDFIPNHTSNRHPWFLQSKLRGADNPYADFYVWHKGRILDNGSRIPPNNWLSKSGISSWTWCEERQEFYYHRFMPQQPDLNWRNPDVKRLMLDVMMYWANKGIDGFRVDGITNLFEVNFDKDEPLKFPHLPKDEFLSYNHIYTKHSNEIHDVMQQWRHLLEEFETKTGKHIALFPEAYDDQKFVETMKYYENGADMPLNFNLLYIHQANCTARCLHGIIDNWLCHMPADKWPNFMIGSHDVKRITTRKGAEFADVYNMMLLTLPGAAITYQGEELAMNDIFLTFEESLDQRGKAYGPSRFHKFSRDASRGPMQWDNGRNAGFSKANKTWIPVCQDYKERNVEKMINSSRNSLQNYRQVAALRHHPAFSTNKISYCLITEDIFSYVRRIPKHSFLIILNVGSRTISENYTQCNYVKDFCISNVVTPGVVHDELQPGMSVDLSKITLKPGDGIILQCRI